MPRQFRIDVTLEHGQLHESLHLDADRQLMIGRLENILLDTSPMSKDLREGVIQILIDQLRNDNGHEPIILTSGDEPGDDEEQLVWNCDFAQVEVEIDKYRDTPKTPHKGTHGNPFKFSGGKKGHVVESKDHKDKVDFKRQKFYKFTLEGEDRQGNKLKLDPCIICEK